jgi:hypothetical protein
MHGKRNELRSVLEVLAAFPGREAQPQEKLPDACRCVQANPALYPLKLLEGPSAGSAFARLIHGSCALACSGTPRRPGSVDEGAAPSSRVYVLA